MTREQALAELATLTEADFEAMTLSPEEDHLTDEDVERIVAEVRASRPGRPSLSENGSVSPRIQFRGSPYLAAKLNLVAQHKGLRKSDVARAGLEAYLDRELELINA
jgi:hypothetical protein